MKRSHVGVAVALVGAGLFGSSFSSTAGAGFEVDPVYLGAFPVGTVINAPYACDDSAEIAGGAWGRESESGPREDVSLSIDGSNYAFTANAEPGVGYIALVVCGLDDADEQLERVGPLESIFDVGTSTDQYLYSFDLYSVDCDGEPEPIPTTTTIDEATTTTEEVILVDGGPSRMPHAPVTTECPDPPSGGSGPSLPSTGSSTTLIAAAGMLMIIGGGVLLVRRRPA